MGGRRKGIPNKVTGDARQFLAAMIGRQLPHVEKWIRQASEGIKNEDGSWLVRPDPKGATQLIAQVADFTIPRLARTEVVGDSKQPLSIEFVNVKPPGKSEEK